MTIDPVWIALLGHALALGLGAMRAYAGIVRNLADIDARLRAIEKGLNGRQAVHK